MRARLLATLARVSRRRFQKLVRVAAVASTAVVLAYLVVGHAAHAGTSATGPMHEVGICLLLATAMAGSVLMPKRRLRPLSSLRARSQACSQLATLTAAALPQPPFAPMRASPAWLQRFLH